MSYVINVCMLCVQYINGSDTVLTIVLVVKQILLDLKTSITVLFDQKSANCQLYCKISILFTKGFQHMIIRMKI